MHLTQTFDCCSIRVKTLEIVGIIYIKHNFMWKCVVKKSNKPPQFWYQFLYVISLLRNTVALYNGYGWNDVLMNGYWLVGQKLEILSFLAFFDKAPYSYSDILNNILRFLCDQHSSLKSLPVKWILSQECWILYSWCFQK